MLVAHLGHSTGVILESYIDKNNVAKGLWASRAHIGWTDVDIEVKVARLESLGASNSDQIDKLIICTLLRNRCRLPEDQL